jgi:hypothetical protein
LILVNGGLRGRPADVAWCQKFQRQHLAVRVLQQTTTTTTSIASIFDKISISMAKG